MSTLPTLCNYGKTRMYSHFQTGDITLSSPVRQFHMTQLTEKFTHET